MKTLATKSVKRFYVKYFNGFSLEGEKVLFQSYFKENSLEVVGFSYGAQQAVEYTYNTKERIDKLILLSPAFFQTQKEAFVRTQLKHFSTQKENYVKQFLANVSYPADINLTPYVKIGTKDELEALLSYKWQKHKFQAIQDKGIRVEVFLGGKDKIINSQDALAFFSELSTSYYLKDAGHLLTNK